MNGALLSKAILWVYAVLIAALAWMGSMESVPINDFGNYYYGSHFLLEGDFGTWVYDPGTFNQAVENEGQEGVFLNYTPVPPVTAVLYAPLALLNVHWAKWLFNLLNAGLLIWLGFRWVKRYKPSLLALVMMLSFLLVLRSNFAQGQSYIIVLALLMEGFHWRQRGRSWPSALLWSLAIVLKVFPAIVLLLLVVERDWKQLGRVGVALLGWVAVSVPFITWEVWSMYLFEVLPRLMAGEINDPFSASYQSMTVVLRSLFVEDRILNPNPVWNFPQAFYLIDALFKLSVLYLVARSSMALDSSLKRFALILLAGMIVSGYGTYYSLLLLLPLALAVSDEHPRMEQWILFVLAMVMLPADALASLGNWARFPRLFALLGLLGLALFRWRPRVRWSHAAGILVLGFTMGLVNIPQPEPSELMLGNNDQLLTLDYDPNGVYMRAAVRTATGVEDNTYTMAALLIDSTRITVRDNQLWDGKRQLTNTRSRKRKPRLVNGMGVLYLSDYGRGVGFYALRHLSLAEETPSDR